MSVTTLAIMVIVAALVLGLVVMETISLPQQQGDSRSCTPGSIAFNASNGMCFQEVDPRSCTPGSIAFNASNGMCLRGIEKLF